MLECTNYTQTFFKKTFALFAIKNTGNGGSECLRKKYKLSYFTIIVKYQMVLLGTFTLNFFLAVDLWKIFIKK
jgi:hypothetical protein